MAEAAPASPEVLAGRFRVDGPPLGRGESGVVWPATDLGAGGAVAVKVLHDHLTADPAARERLLREAGLAGRLVHPGIVRVLGAWADTSAGRARWLLVTERVDGVSLEHIGAALPPASVIALGHALAGALATAHARGLVHGDVRPGNVLVGRGGARLYDFGAAGLAEVSARPGETAPEVADGAPARAQADLYGLGVVLYQALAGRPPFAGPTPFARLAAQRELPVDPPGPKGLVALIRALLDPDPCRRPVDADAVATALARLRKNPVRLRLPRPWLPPLKLAARWVVHGLDPATGAAAWVRADIGRGEARRLVARLRAQGWQVRASRQAMGLGDLAQIAVFAVLLGVALPVVGFPIGLVLGWRLRRRTLRPEIPDALPPARAHVPPLRLGAGTEHAVAAALLLLCCAVLLLVNPLYALPPALLLAGIAAEAGKLARPHAPAAVRAVQARVAVVLGELRLTLDRLAAPLDQALALEGELHAIEAEWRAGAEPAAVLARAESLRERLVPR